MSKRRLRILKVLDRVEAQILRADKDELKVWEEEFETMLQSLAESDFFGTEQQCDPRGDGRECEWHMWHVEDIDPPLSRRPDDEEE